MLNPLTCTSTKLTTTPKLKRKDRTRFVPLSGNTSVVLWGMDVLQTVPICVVRSSYIRRHRLQWLHASWALLSQTVRMCVYAVPTVPVMPMTHISSLCPLFVFNNMPLFHLHIRFTGEI